MAFGGFVRRGGGNGKGAGEPGPAGPEGPQGPPGQGIQVMPAVANYAALVALPPSANQPGDARLTNDVGNWYAWNGSSWDLVGLIRGPQGLTGNTGSPGRDGVDGAPGAEGPPGPQGPEGLRGQEGPEGPEGPVGPAGTGVQLKGAVPTPANLPPTGNALGDGYMVESTGDLWVYTGTAVASPPAPLGWELAGPIRGPEGQRGPIGPEGPEGPQGPRGPEGQEGREGPRGAEGPPGPEGPTGPAGIGIGLKGAVPTPANLPPTGNTVGDGYMVESTGDLWVYTGTAVASPPAPLGWELAGPIRGPEGQRGPIGPEGPEGPQGLAGPPGLQGPEGIEGPEGPEGREGPRGQEGPQGPEGPMGPAGTGVQLKGAVPTPADLPPSGNAIGDGYMVESTGDLWVYTGTAVAAPPAPVGWELAGPIRGPEGQRGPIGPEGPEGPQGLDGPRGLQGHPTEILVNNNLIGSAEGLHFINGTNVTISGVHNPPLDRIDVTINSTATGGPGGGENQSPWLRNIDAAGYQLNSAGRVDVNGVGTGAPWDTYPVPAPTVNSVITVRDNRSTDGAGGSVLFGSSRGDFAAIRAWYYSAMSPGAYPKGYLSIYLRDDSASPNLIQAIAIQPKPSATPSQSRVIIEGDLNVRGNYYQNNNPFTGGSGVTPSFWVNDNPIGTRATLNLKAGANVTINGIDNAAGRVDITITATGGTGGGGGDPQSPWLSDILGNDYRLLGAKAVQIVGQGQIGAFFDPTLSDAATLQINDSRALEGAGGTFAFGAKGIAFFAMHAYNLENPYEPGFIMGPYPVGHMIFETRNDTYSSALTDAMSIQFTGNVGVGPSVYASSSLTVINRPGYEGTFRIVSQNPTNRGVYFLLDANFFNVGITGNAPGTHAASQYGTAEKWPLWVTLASGLTNLGYGLQVTGNINVIGGGQYLLNGNPLPTGGGNLSFLVDGTPRGTRAAVNFISGTNVILSGIDNNTDARVDITINSLGGGDGTGGPPQSPWLTDINAANLQLQNVNAIGIATGLTTPRKALDVGMGDVIVNNNTGTQFRLTHPSADRGFVIGNDGTNGRFGITGPNLAVDGSIGISVLTMRLSDGYMTVNSPNTTFPNAVFMTNYLNVSGGLQVAGLNASGSIVCAGSVNITGSGQYQINGVPIVQGVTPSFSYNGTLAGTRNALNLIAGTNITLTGTDDGTRANITINATGGAAPAPPSFYADGVLAGTWNALNLKAGANVTLHGANNTLDGRAEITITATAAPGGANQSPWTSNIIGDGYNLLNAGRIGIGTMVPLAPVDVVVPSTLADIAAAGGGGFRLATGAVNTAVSLLMGVHDSDYSWIQSIYPGAAMLDLALQPLGGKVGIGIGMVAPRAIVDVRVPSHDPSFGAAGAGALRLATGVVAEAVSLIMGVHDTDYSWIQSTWPSQYHLALALQPLGGNVGVGTTTPGRKLDVWGDIRFGGDLYSYGGVVINGSGEFVSGAGIDTRGECRASNYSVYDSGGTLRGGYNGQVSTPGGGAVNVINGIIVG